MEFGVQGRRQAQNAMAEQGLGLAGAHESAVSSLSGGEGAGDSDAVVALDPEQDDSFHQEIDEEERRRARHDEEQRARARQISPTDLSPLGTPGSGVSDFSASADDEDES